MEGARQRCFEVANHGVDPIEVRRGKRFEATDDFRGVDPAGINHCRQVSEFIANHQTARHQVGPGPVGDDLVEEDANPAELEGF